MSVEKAIKSIVEKVVSEEIREYRVVLDQSDIYNLMAMISNRIQHDKEFAEDLKRFMKSIIGEGK
jgi:hypothetical protein